MWDKVKNTNNVSDKSIILEGKSFTQSADTGRMNSFSLVKTYSSTTETTSSTAEPPMILTIDQALTIRNTIPEIYDECGQELGIEDHMETFIVEDDSPLRIDEQQCCRSLTTKNVDGCLGPRIDHHSFQLEPSPSPVMRSRSENSALKSNDDVKRETADGSDALKNGLEVREHDELASGVNVHHSNVERNVEECLDPEIIDTFQSITTSMVKSRSEVSESNQKESNNDAMRFYTGEEVGLEDAMEVLRLDTNAMNEVVVNHLSSSPSPYMENDSDAFSRPKTVHALESESSETKSSRDTSTSSASWSNNPYSGQNIGEEMILENALEVLKVDDYVQPEPARNSTFAQNNTESDSKLEKIGMARLQCTQSVTDSRSGLSLSTASRSNSYTVEAGNGKDTGLDKSFKPSKIEDDVATTQAMKFTPVETDEDWILNPKEASGEQLNQIQSKLSGTATSNSRCLSSGAGTQAEMRDPDEKPEVEDDAMLQSLNFFFQVENDAELHLESNVVPAQALQTTNSASKLITQTSCLSSTLSNCFSESNMGEEVDLIDVLEMNMVDKKNIDEKKSETSSLVIKISESEGTQIFKRTKGGLRYKIKTLIRKSSRKKKSGYEVAEVLPELASVKDDPVTLATESARLEVENNAGGFTSIGVSKSRDHAEVWKSEKLVDAVPDTLKFNSNEPDVVTMTSEMATVTGADQIENLPQSEATGSVYEDDLAKGHFAFRPVDVTIRLKSLSGLARTRAGKKIPFRKSHLNHDGERVDREEETVRAVVIYRKNTIASDKFVSTNVPSLPLLVEKAKDKSSLQVYAKWPSKVVYYDDDSSMSSAGTKCFNPSSFTLNRTVRVVTFAGQKNDRRESNYNSNKTSYGEDSYDVKHKQNEDHTNFLSAISQAFAPELVDLHIGLVRGAKEIIPIGVASVVVSGEFETLDLNVPIVRDYNRKLLDGRMTRSSFLSSIAGSSKKDFVSFPSDPETKYKITDGAFLRLQLRIEPSSRLVNTRAKEYATRGLSINNRKTDFRIGPINKAIKSRRKIERLLSLEKLSLQQRLRLYFELRKAPGSYDLPEYPDNKTNDDENTLSLHNLGVCLRSQSDSSVLCSSFSHPAPKRCDVEEDDSSEFIPPHYRTPTRVAPLSEVLLRKSGNRHACSHSEHSDESSSFYSSLQSVLDASHPQRTSAINLLKQVLACDPSFILSDNEMNALKYYASDFSHVEEDSLSIASSSESDNSSSAPRRRYR